MLLVYCDDAVKHVTEKEAIFTTREYSSVVHAGKQLGDLNALSYRHFTCRKERIQLLMHAAMVIAGNWFANGQCLQRDSSKGLWVGGEGNHHIRDSHDLAEVVAVADEGDVVCETGVFDGLLDLFMEVEFLGVWAAGYEAVGGDAFFFEPSDDLNKVEMPLPSGDAAR